MAVDEPTEEEGGGGPGGRPFWSGTISFGLVSVPVALYPANRPRGRVGLRMVSSEGSAVQRRYVCPEEEREVDWGEIVRGYEVEKGKFVVLTDEELEAVEPNKTREIDLRLFVSREEIDPALFDRAYFLTPTAGSTKAYRLLAEVMEKTDRAGVATFVMRTKEYVVAIFAEGGILQAETLRFPDEIRTPADIGLPKVAKTRPADVKRFTTAIGKLEKKVDFSEFMDEEEERLEKLVEKKRKKGEDVIKAEAPPDDEEGGGQVIDLLEVLRKSLQAPAGAGGRKPAKKAGAAKTPSRKKKTTKKRSS